MMPAETKQAIEWALQQKAVDFVTGQEHQITRDTPHDLVDKVREYFNTNNIEYPTYSYDDLIPFLN